MNRDELLVGRRIGRYVGGMFLVGGFAATAFGVAAVVGVYALDSADKVFLCTFGSIFTIVGLTVFSYNILPDPRLKNGRYCSTCGKEAK